ncbi:MAG: STAS domain-containing protein [Acidimicrobiia bacterium]|nr:STAS domain-containing protein [Acidimicrobiia bacterium]
MHADSRLRRRRWPVAEHGALEIQHADEDDHVVLYLAGDADIHTAPALRSDLASLVDQAKPVVVDLSALAFIDSTAIGILVAALKRFRAAGGDLSLRRPVARVRKVFEITGLTRVFEIDED